MLAPPVHRFRLLVASTLRAALLAACAGNEEQTAITPQPEISPTTVAERPSPTAEPAARADLRPEDIIVRLAGEEITNNGDLLQALTTHRAGETVTVEYYRGEELREADVTLSERP